jgi:hypothetical protein
MAVAKRRGQACGEPGLGRARGPWILVSVAAALLGGATQDCSACAAISCGDSVVVTFSPGLPGPASYRLRVVADGTCMETTLGAPPPLDAGDSAVGPSAGAGGDEASPGAPLAGALEPAPGASCPAANYLVSGDYAGFILNSAPGHLQVTVSRDGVVVASGSFEPNYTGEGTEGSCPPRCWRARVTLEVQPAGGQ